MELRKCAVSRHERPRELAPWPLPNSSSDGQHRNLQPEHIPVSDCQTGTSSANNVGTLAVQVQWLSWALIHSQTSSKQQETPYGCQSSTMPCAWALTWPSLPNVVPLTYLLSTGQLQQNDSLRENGRFFREYFVSYPPATNHGSDPHPASCQS